MEKAKLLENINWLEYELWDYGADLSRMPKVNQDSTVDEVYSVIRILQRSYNRRRLNSFGIGFIMAFESY